MEGQTGISIEISSPQTLPDVQQASAKADGSAGITGDTKASTTIQKESENSESTQEQDADNAENSQDQKTEQLEEQTEQNEKPKQDEDELNPEEIEKGFDTILENLTFDSKKKEGFETNLAALLLENDKDKKAGEKLIETSAELLRILKLIFALIIMFITNPKDGYTGEDFSLSEIPPEGDEGYDLPDSDHDSRDSWKKVREGVQNIKQPLPFNEFMNLVLKINEDNPVKKFKVKKEETKSEKILKNLIKNRLSKQIARSGSKPRRG